MKKMLAAIFALFTIVGSLSGCNNIGASNKAENMPTVVWYLRPLQQEDEQAVFAKLSEITEKNVGAKLEIKRIDPGAYSEKLNLAVSSGEKFDICHTAVRYGFNGFSQNGAFLDITNLLPKYAPKTYENIPQHMWEATKYQDKIYGVINYQIVARQHGIVALKSLVDKYKFDLKSVKRLEDLEPFYKSIKANEGSMIVPYGDLAGAAYSFALQHYLGFDNVGSETMPGVVAVGDDSLTVFNQYESEIFKNYIALMRDWYTKGYIKRDSATTTSGGELRKQGYLATICDMIGPGFETSFKDIMGGRDVETVIFDPPFINSNSLLASLNAISATSQNPEKALQILELFNTNKDNIYNIINFGFEGEHYKKISENRIEPIVNSGYYPNCAWMFGNQFNAYLVPGQKDDVWEETIELNKSAGASKLLGFRFDSTNVTNETSQCGAVLGEYLKLLASGSVETETIYNDFINKLKVAGVDKIIAEKQAQINAWKSK